MAKDVETLAENTDPEAENSLVMIGVWAIVAIVAIVALVLWLTRRL